MAWPFNTAEPATVIHVYEAGFLNEIDTLDLPRMTLGASVVQSRGRFLFFHSDGSKVHVVVSARAAGAATASWGICTRRGVGSSRPGALSGATLAGSAA